MQVKFIEENGNVHVAWSEREKYNFDKHLSNVAVHVL